MGLISDILEHNREIYAHDPCMVYRGVGNTTALYLRLDELSRQAEQTPAEVNWSIQLPKSGKSSRQQAEKYEKILSLQDNCVYREKLLCYLRNNNSFKTAVVQDVLSEYLTLLCNTRDTLNEVLQHAKQQNISLHHTFIGDEEGETKILLQTLLKTLFYYLSHIANSDDTRFLQFLFSDMAVLIRLLEPDNKYKFPKEVCRDYYERNFQPSYGIECCENCKMPLYRECPYCFKCFVRKVRK